MRHFFPNVRDRLTRAMVKFLLQCNGDGLLLKTMRSQCFLDTHYHCYWCDYLDLTIVDDLFRCYFFFTIIGWFSWFFICFKFAIVTLQFFTKPSGPMFLQGFFANHRSNHAIFAMYKSTQGVLQHWSTWMRPDLFLSGQSWSAELGAKAEHRYLWLTWILPVELVPLLPQTVLGKYPAGTERF